MPTIDLGKIVYTWQGTYNPAQAYNIFDTCTYNNVVYICIQAAAAGISPTNTSYFSTMVNGNTVASGMFSKADPTTVVFTKTGAGTVSLKAGTSIECNGSVLNFSTATAVIMPSLTAGTDYAIYACTDGTVRADANFTAPTGYTAANSRKIGGFHYALCNLNIDATTQINAYSLWDLKWKPACPDPRGMALIDNHFWADIYLLGVNHPAVGTSANAQTIVIGTTPPKKALGFGGNGSTSYTTLMWYEAAEVLCDYGKKLLSYDDFIAAAYGVTEATSAASQPTTTGHTATFTSAWGIEQATGCVYVWGSNLGGPYGSATWTADPSGRGSTYNQPNAVILGGSGGSGAYSGSRCANWSLSPTSSSSIIGARGRCDHLRLA
jgi:hypothetical protein